MMGMENSAKERNGTVGLNLSRIGELLSPVNNRPHFTVAHQYPTDSVKEKQVDH